MEIVGMRPRVEQDQRSQLDAVLVHSFLISRKECSSNGQEQFRGSLRTRLATRAAELLYHKGQAKNVVVVGGTIKGPSFPPTASLVKDELVNKYHVPEGNIFVGGKDEYNTEEEAKTLSKFAQEKNWSSVASVSFREHESSVRDSLSVIPGNIHTSFMSVEDIIDEHDKPAVGSLVKRFNRSWYHCGYIAYEGFKAIFRDNVPGVYGWMLETNEQLRRTRDKSNEWILHSFDVFRS